VIAERVRGVVALEVVERGAIDVEREVHLALGLDRDQLLARAAGADQLIARRGIDHELVDRYTGIDAVQRLEPALNAGEHYWITLWSGSTRMPAARSFFSSHSSRVRSHIS